MPKISDFLWPFGSDAQGEAGRASVEATDKVTSRFGGRSRLVPWQAAYRERLR
jgi:hypothetical protein